MRVQAVLVHFKHCDECGVFVQMIFVVYMILVTLLLVNMLIAMMGHTYETVNESQKEWYRQVRVYYSHILSVYLV